MYCNHDNVIKDVYCVEKEGFPWINMCILFQLSYREYNKLIGRNNRKLYCTLWSDLQGVTGTAFPTEISSNPPDKENPLDFLLPPGYLTFFQSLWFRNPILLYIFLIYYIIYNVHIIYFRKYIFW